MQYSPGAKYTTLHITVGATAAPAFHASHTRRRCADRGTPPATHYILRAPRPCRAWVHSSARSRRAPASGAPLSRKWLMKSFRPSRSRPSAGLSDTLGRKGHTSVTSRPLAPLGGPQRRRHAQFPLKQRAQCRTCSIGHKSSSFHH